MWEWQVTCSLCGYKSRFYRSHKVARGRAIIHAVWSHIFGHTTIAAREAKRGEGERNMRITPKSEIEIVIETGGSFGFGDAKAKFHICERTDGGLEIISQEGKILTTAITEQNRAVVIHEA
jgi:hypothetical protein